MISVLSQNYNSGKSSSSSSRSVLLYLLLITSMCLSDAVRAKRTSFIDDDTTIRTEYVGNNRTIWAMFNLTDEQMGRIRAGINASGKDQTNETRDSQIFDIIKRQRLEDIRTRIQSAFDAGNSEESQEQPLHQVAAYPICNTGESWQLDNNVTIKFSNSVFEFKRDNLHLESAILRLYKLKPNGTVSANNDEELQQQQQQQQQQRQTETVDQLKLKRCDDPIIESQIRVTVSLLQPGRNKLRKKRICNTLMMNVSKTGWVEIDIKRAVLIWKSISEQQAQHQQNRSAFGWLMIEVHDEEERPLKPGQYFNPPNCEQADVAIPWNYYGPESTVSSFETQQVPRYPRLDVLLSGYASFAPKNYNKTQNKKLHENIMRQLNLPKNAAEIDNESTTSNSPTVDNLLESFESNKMLTHQHRKRHYQQQHEHHQAHAQLHEQINGADYSQPQHNQHRRRLRRHHHKHPQHHRNQHEQQEQQQ